MRSNATRFAVNMKDFIAQHDTLRAVIRINLLPIVGISWLVLNLGPAPILALFSMMVVLMSFAAFFISRRMRFNT